MAINITDSSSTIKIEVTTAYERAGYKNIPVQVKFAEKADLNIKSIGDDVIIYDDENSYKFHYSDITTPAGASAAAVAALIEAFKDTGAPLGSVTIAAIGNAATTVAGDGDLQTIDTEAESYSVNPTANTAGAANVSYTTNFLLRWAVNLLRLLRVKGDVADNAAQVNTSPVYVGGKAVESATYAPAYTAGDAVGAAFDKDTGALLTLPANLAPSADAVTVYANEVIVSSTIVMSVAGAYATGDYMGTTTTPQSFASASRTSNGTAKVTGITISDKITTTNVAMELWLLSASFVAPTDNAAWTISDAEALTVLGIIPLPVSGWFASGANQVYNDNTLNIAIKPAATSLFYALVARGTTPAFTSLDLTVNLAIAYN